MDFIAEGFIQAFRMLLTMDEETTVIVVTTFKLTALAICCAVPLGLLTGLGRISRNRCINLIASTYVEVIRGIPLATQLMIFYFVIFAPMGLDRYVVAVIAYGINSGAYCTEIFRAGRALA